MLVYSRLPAGGRIPRERCLAILPAEGGTLRGTYCPPLPATPADTFIDTWVEPALSPDGSRIAFAWQKGAPASYYTWARDLVVAPAHDPAHPTFTWPVWYVLPDGRIATSVSKISWTSGTRLRLLASYERVFKVKGGGASRLTDTVTDMYALVDVDLGSGQVSLVPGGDSTIAYAPAFGGAYWLVKSSDSTRLLALAPGADTTNLVGFFGGPVTDITNVDGIPVAVRSGGLALEWLDINAGLVSRLDWDTPISRIVALPGTRRFVAEVEKTAIQFAEDGANLWVFTIP